MNIFSFIYTEVLFRPLFNLLVGITTVVPGHNIGLGIIGVTLAVRLILLPSFLHQARAMQANQSKMQQVKKELDRIKKQYKNDQAKQAEETMRIYKEAGINPAQGCLPLIIQLPILLALYRVFLSGINTNTYHYLYSFIKAPEVLGSIFLGINLNAPSVILSIIAGVGQFIQMKYMTPPQSAAQPGADENTAQMMASMQKNMAYIFPVMTVIIAIKLPAALALYWVLTTVFALAQQYWFKKHLNLSSATAM